MATEDLESLHEASASENESGGEEQKQEQEQQEAAAAASSSKKRKTAITEIEVDLTQPEPPSKKAKRLLKKGKTLPAKANSDDDDGDDKAGKSEDAKKKKERSPYGVWIGNLRFTVTKKELREWFVENSGGSITDEMITRVHMPMTKPVNGGPKKTTPENRGFAYVDFATLDANVAAIALSETEWYRRKVLIKDSKSYEGRPDKVEVDAKADEEGADGAKGTEVKKNPSTKVFVGNLSFTTTEDDLHAHFEKCGKIRWIKVATFEDTGKCKGYGWVNFEEAEAAEWAVKGFVKVRETIDTLEDFMDVDEDANENSDAEDDDATKAKKAKAAKKAAEKEPPRIKTRKWWVNQLLGRNLKIELAEDDQTRYTKRFKKGGSHNKKDQEAAEQQADRTAPPVRKPYVKEKKPINFATDISVARLTGAPVAHQGKKTTFE